MARTCQTAFAPVRRRRSSADVGVKKERKLVGSGVAADAQGGGGRNQRELARGEGVSMAAVSIALKVLREREGCS